MDGLLQYQKPKLVKEVVVVEVAEEEVTEVAEEEEEEGTKEEDTVEEDTVEEVADIVVVDIVVEDMMEVNLQFTLLSCHFLAKYFPSCSGEKISLLHFLVDIWNPGALPYEKVRESGPRTSHFFSAVSSDRGKRSVMVDVLTKFMFD